MKRGSFISLLAFRTLVIHPLLITNYQQLTGLLIRAPVMKYTLFDSTPAFVSHLARQQRV